MREIGFNQLQHVDTDRAVALAADQPPRAFGQSKAQYGVNGGRNGCDAEHPAPSVFSTNPGDYRIGKVSDDDAENDVELEHAGQPPAISGRGDLGNVKRGRDRRDSDAQTAHEAGGDEHADPVSKPAADRRQEVEDADEQERGLAAQAIRRPTAQERAKHGAIKRGTHRQPMHCRTQVPEGLNFLFRTGDDDRIEAKKKPRQRRRDGPENDAIVHGRQFPGQCFPFGPDWTRSERHGFPMLAEMRVEFQKQKRVGE